MLQIKILGTGCPNCNKLEQETKKAVTNLAIEAEFEKVTDYKKIMDYDILSTPGLVINEKVVSSGKIPSQGEITSFLTSALENN
ncbi:MAG: thioredoxin family protein [Chloroflexota bacterium]|nr:MAG: thioredoxin family protein [Chloroflexota bacterium]HDD61273.1 thioredoxin family protein [Chloroflexota bacterium]